MKKILPVLLILFFTINPSYSKTEKFDAKSQSFMDFGRYVETLEINENEVIEEKVIRGEDAFEKEVINDVTKRYEEHAVELKLDDIYDDALTSINNSRVFKLQTNETQYIIEQNIKNENMIWDTSRSFSGTFLKDSRYMAPIPSVVNSSKISSNVSDVLSAEYGQTYLFNAQDTSVYFVRANESTYNTGSVISYKGDSLNLSVGSFSSSYNHDASGGAILSSNSIKLPYNAGSFVLGGAYFANEAQKNDKTTGGGFIEYTYKRLKLNAQIGQSKYSNSSIFNTSFYFIPELQLSDSISFKTRLIRNITQNTMQDELALSYKPKKSNRNFEIELNASNQYNQNSTIKQRIKLTTSFKI